MNDLLNKISSYNLFNYLFPGVLFAIIATKWTIYDFTIDNLFLGAFLYYFIGMTISRIGSLWIEKLLKKSKFVKFSDYKDFVQASKKDSQLNLFSQINNTYRTIAALGLCLLLVKVYSDIDSNIEIPEMITSVGLLIFIVVVYLLSYRKQTDYINKRIKANKD